MASGALTYLLYGLATQGWMMYALILCNLLSFAAGPALQGIISKASDAGEQGELMGSLQSISSVGIIIMLAGQHDPGTSEPPAAAGLAHRQHLLPVRHHANPGHPRGLALLQGAARGEHCGFTTK
jgi:hypothetical protein